MNHKSQRGFTLIELMAVLAIIAVLAGIITTSAIRLTKDSKETAARADIDQIEQALTLFYIDLGELPARKDKDTPYFYKLLFSGMDSTGAASASTTMQNPLGVDQSSIEPLDLVDFPLLKRDNIYYHLVKNAREYGVYKESKHSSTGWRSSYIELEGDLLDPWGNSYLVFMMDKLDGTYQMFLLSAGKNQVLDTNPALDSIVHPKDLGITWIARP